MSTDLMTKSEKLQRIASQEHLLCIRANSLASSIAALDDPATTKTAPATPFSILIGSTGYTFGTNASRTGKAVEIELATTCIEIRRDRFGDAACDEFRNFVREWLVKQAAVAKAEYEAFDVVAEIQKEYVKSE